MKVCILGHFGGDKKFFDGQTIKTKTLYDGLKKYTDNEINIVDTYNWKIHPLKLYNKIKIGLKNNDIFILLPAKKGIQIFAPLVCKLNKKYNRKVYYDVVGGWLPELLEDKPWLINYINKFDEIWVETNDMSNKLLKLEIKNIFVLPNFKDLEVLRKEDLVYSIGSTIKLCTFSRVMKEKGIEEAIYAVIKVNQELNKEVFSLDIYGQIDKMQQEWFNNLISDVPNYIQYRGIIDFNNSVNVLKNYTALLFPTYYEGEGCAGTIIDAYAAGLPIIATKWKYNGEIILNNFTGKLVEPKDVDEIKNILYFIYEELDKWNEMKLNCLIQADKYLSKNLIRTINYKINQ